MSPLSGLCACSLSLHPEERVRQVTWEAQQRPRELRDLLGSHRGQSWTWQESVSITFTPRLLAARPRGPGEAMGLALPTTGRTLGSIKD